MVKRVPSETERETGNERESAWSGGSKWRGESLSEGRRRAVNTDKYGLIKERALGRNGNDEGESNLAR